MKNSRLVLFILIVSLAACLAVAFSACDLDDVSDEELLVAGQEDLSMYETKIPDYSGGNLYLVKIKDEFKNRIKTAIIPSEIYAVSWNAFEGCVNLETVIVKEGVNSIGNGAFKNCGKLKNIELPEGVREIESEAFVDCADLSALELPVSLRRIDDMVFFGSKVNVSSYQIYYNGTVEQWKAIENYMNYEYVAQCTDGVVKYNKTA